MKAALQTGRKNKMKQVLNAFALIALTTSAVPAAPQMAASNTDANSTVQITPRVRPGLPKATGPCADSLVPQACVYILQRRERERREPFLKDFIATPCQATPQPLVDQVAKPGSVYDFPFSICDGQRRTK
jgi:hypothetical protein